jgi:hypothetical protein
VEGQRLQLNLGVNEDRADASFDSREFAGGVTLNDVGGGASFFGYSVEFNTLLDDGQTATLTVNGVEFTLIADNTFYEPYELAYYFEQLLDGAGITVGTHEVGDGTYALIVYNFRAPAQISADVAGVEMSVLEEFDYGANHGPNSGDLTYWERGELSTVRTGAGDDEVEVVEDAGRGDIAYGELYDLGEGNNSLSVEDGSVHGTVRFGAGEDSMYVHDDVGAGADVNFGDGNNSLRVDSGITDGASIRFGAGNDTVEAATISHAASVDLGDGNNDLYVNRVYDRATVTFGDGDNYVVFSGMDAGVSDASLSFGNGDNFVEGDEYDSVYIENGAQIVFGDGDNHLHLGEDSAIRGEAVVSFGDGDNHLESAYIDYAQVEFGHGDNRLSSYMVNQSTVTLGDGDNEAGFYDVNNSTITFGDGDNEMGVWDDLSGSSVTFGEGSNSLYAERIEDSEVTFGNGGNSLSADDVVASSVVFGSGDDSVDVGDTIKQGSQLDFGAGNDSLILGSSSGPIYMAGEDSATVVDMGSGDDTVQIAASSDNNSDVLVRSGSFLRGGEGNDTLTVYAVDDASVVARTQAQQVYVVFSDDSYAVDQVVTVTIAGVPYSYPVQASDIVQGNPGATRMNVAAGVFAVIEGEADCTLTPCLGHDGPYIELTGSVGAADVEVTVEGGEIFTAQIADTGISGFETLNLVAGNARENDYNDYETATISADFSLIEGVEKINLSSEETTRSYLQDSESNGAYYSVEEGSRAGFVLQNLPADLAEPIAVSGHEVTATGNRQVARISINDQSGVDGHAVGDVISVWIDGQEFSITVTEADLSGADGLEDAETIAARLAEVIAAGETGFTVARDGNVITLIGSSDEDVEIELNGNGDYLDTCVQSATASDDREIDVALTTHLALDADTDNDTLALEINGEGNFDLSIDAAWGEDVAYEHLTIDVQDEYSHYIDTNADDCRRAFARGNLLLTGGAIGASLVLDNVLAANVTSTSAADVEVIFANGADQEEQYSFNVSTQGGDDVVDMRNVIFSTHSTVNLGDGVDRLKIGNGRLAADSVTSGSPWTDEGRMFRNVRGVEELQFGGEDAITFDDDAYNAGFSKLIIEDGSNLLFKVGDEFERDLTVEMEDCVDLQMEVYNRHAITVTAHNDVTVGALIDDDAEGDFTLTANDDNTVTVISAGSGALNVTVDDDNEVVITQSGNGDVTVVSDSDNYISVTQSGAGDVHVTTEDGSYVGITIGEDADEVGDVTVVQTDSDSNRISLEGLRQEQNVTVDITVYGAGESTLIADLCDEECYNTDLEVFGSTGGIDQLIVRTNEEYGASDYVGVFTEDSWAVAGEDRTAIDMTIDASTVDAELVVINAMNEGDANLAITGSSTASNALFGGAGRDTITGGEAMDVLQGDRASAEFRTYEVLFDSSIAGTYTLTIDGETLSFTAPGVITAWDVATEFAAHINGLIADVSGSNVSGAYEAWVANNMLYVAARSLNDDFELSATNAVDVDLVHCGLAGGIASDILEGGEGADVYLFAESQFDTMDTIVGLNLGGATDGTQEDIVLLGGYLAADVDPSGWGFEDLVASGISSKNSIEVERVVNGGDVITLTGADLESAVSRLFEANGWFEASGSAATNSAGLFNYGDDTYLIAVGHDANGGFGIDDYIIKVTGATGTLDVSDFYVPMPT